MKAETVNMKTLVFITQNRVTSTLGNSSLFVDKHL